MRYAMREKLTVAVVGGGIVGLAHAYVAARRGHKVIQFERNRVASGASVRNFGMIWPIGQAAGEIQSMALRSREIWLGAAEEARIAYRPTGSLHVAYADDEAEVLREFAEIGPGAGYACRLLDREGAVEAGPAVVAEGLRCALRSETELTVDPREAVAQLAALLTEMGVDRRYGAQVTGIELPWVETSLGGEEADCAIVCSGDDFQTLYPTMLAESGITRCKLQMLRTVPQPGGWQLGPSMAAGLTLRFYPAFSICSSLPALRARIAAEKPEYDRWGIHVLASQTTDGSITLGDSHEYGLDVSPFDRAEVDELILREARTFLNLPSWTIAQRWQGVYATHPETKYYRGEPTAGVKIVTATGGSGMTLSFGLAEQTAEEMEL